MRRFLLPALVLAVAIVASVLAASADDAAEPDTPPAADGGDRLSTPLLSVRRTPEWLRQPTTAGLLDSAVRVPVDAVGDAGTVCASVHINGEPVTEVASSQPLIPGEVQRLLTLAALGTVGPGPFTTEVVRSSDAVITDDGVLEGNLWLIGGADPVLSTNAFIGRFDDGRAFTSLEELALTTAAALRDEGITSIDGRVIGVDSKYDNFPQVFGDDLWTPVEVVSGAVGVTSGLLVDNGLSSFAADSTDPADNIRSSDPVVHAASQFSALLEALAVPVASTAISDDAPETTSRESLASIESPPLADIAARALVDGTTAEMLWREIAVRDGSSDSFAVLFGVNAALGELGLLPDDEAGNFPKVDGSGLSLQNRARCDTLTGVLDPEISGLAAGALPDITMSPLSDCAPSGLESLAVTASARPEVTSMAGQAMASNGDTITFSVIANWLPDESGAFAPRAVCDALLPSVLEAIAQHPAGPAIGELTPLDPGAAE